MTKHVTSTTFNKMPGRVVLKSSESHYCGEWSGETERVVEYEKGFVMIQTFDTIGQAYANVGMMKRGQGSLNVIDNQFKMN